MKVRRFWGIIVTHNRWILDQLCEKDHQWFWSGNGLFSKRLMLKYGLNPKEYYNLVVFNDTAYRRMCPVCGQSEVEFIKLSKGYREYCSRKCSSRAAKTIINRFLAYGYSKAWLYIANINGDPTMMKFGITGVREYNTRQNYRGFYLSNH